MIGWMAWRLHRRGLIGFGAGGFVFSLFYGAAFLQAAGSTPESRAAFGRSIDLVAKQFAFLIPLPVHPETLGGYEQYKWLSGALIMLLIWAALAGAGIARGDEERGLTEQWLAGGLSRRRLLLTRSAAFGLVLAAACLGSVLGISAVAPAVHQDPNLGGELLKALSMAVGLFSCHTLVLLIAQFPNDRQTAVALGVGAPVLLLIVNGIADTVPAAAWIGVISPFHWMERTSSAAPGGSFDLGGTLGLAGAGAVLLAGAAALFARRDLGSGLVRFPGHGRRPVRIASANPLIRLPFSQGLWEQRVGLGVWAASTLVLGTVMVSVTRSVVDSLRADPRLLAIFSTGSPNQLYGSLLGFTWLNIALLLLAAYSVVQVSRWAGQDQEGRLEMLLSTPLSRSRVMAERALEFSLASLLIVAGGYLGVAAALPSAGLGLDAGLILRASALLWPFALAFGGLGVAVAGRWPRIAVPVLASFAGAEYLLADLGPLLQLPRWVANLSVFHLYGNPLIAATSWTAPASMLLVFAAGFGAAILLIRRRDISS